MERLRMATVEDTSRLLVVPLLNVRAAQDVLHICGAMSAEENTKAKTLLDRIVAMLTRLGQRGYSMQGDGTEYGQDIDDTDTDSDTD